MRTTVEQKDYARLRSSAHNTMHNLISREECLAYSDNGVYKGVIDVEKLENFTSSYAGIEPECAASTDFDYRVNVTTLPENFTSYEDVGRIQNIFEQILDNIAESNVDFILDISGSMSEADVGEEGLTRMECARNFLISFVEEMDNESHIGLMEYNCSHNRVFEFTQLEGNREYLIDIIEDIEEHGGTDLGTPLNKSFIYIHESDVEADEIVFFTDGEPYRWYDDMYLPEYQDYKDQYDLEDGDPLCVVEGFSSRQDNVTEVALDYKDDIPVHTIAFGDDADPVIMERVANITGGDFYETDICEELVPGDYDEVLKLNIDAKSWDFGIEAFSVGDAMDNEITFSMPVVLRYSADNVRRGIMELKAVSGSLETISSMLQRTCRQANLNQSTSTSTKIYVPHPIFYDDNDSDLCMVDGHGTCKSIDCPVSIDFDNMETSGEYLISFEYDTDIYEIVVNK